MTMAKRSKSYMSDSKSGNELMTETWPEQRTTTNDPKKSAPVPKDGGHSDKMKK